MRCPDCNQWITPDLATCPECGRRLRSEQGNGVLDRYREQVRGDWQAWRETVFADDRDRGDADLEAAVKAATAAASGLAGTGPPGSSPAVTLEAEPLGVLNLLLLHAGFSPFRRLAVSAARSLAGTRLTVTATPPVIAPLTQPLAEHPGGELEPPAVAADSDAFLALDEAVPGLLHLAVQGEDGEPLAQQSLSVSVQNGNEWIAREGVEAALAGLVTPNATAVTELVGRLDSDLLAYQDRTGQRLHAEVGLMYEAVRNLGLQYIGVPPSFEETGQKIFFPDQVLRYGRGCCLDIAVLTAALLERAGFNSLVVIVDNHALGGVWRSDIRSRTAVIRDPALLRRSVAENDLLVWNPTTCFDREGDTPFAAAIAAGVGLLPTCRYAIDIAACREQGYRPVARRTA